MLCDEVAFLPETVYRGHETAYSFQKLEFIQTSVAVLTLLFVGQVPGLSYAIEAEQSETSPAA